MPPLSILDLAFVPEGGTPADALRNTLDLAQHAERWGYRRFWLAEHHNMVGIASAATAVVISIRLSRPPMRQSVRRICIPTTQTSSAKVPLWEYLRISPSTRSKNSSGTNAA